MWVSIFAFSNLPCCLSVVPSKEYALKVLGPNPVLFVRTHRDETGKYGRLLAEVFVRVPYFVDRGGTEHYHHAHSNFVKWVNLNEELVQKGYADVLDL